MHHKICFFLYLRYLAKCLRQSGVLWCFQWPYSIGIIRKTHFEKQHCKHSWSIKDDTNLSILLASVSINFRTVCSILSDKKECCNIKELLLIRSLAKIAEQKYPKKGKTEMAFFTEIMNDAQVYFSKETNITSWISKKDYVIYCVILF